MSHETMRRIFNVVGACVASMAMLFLYGLTPLIAKDAGVRPEDIPLTVNSVMFLVLSIGQILIFFRTSKKDLIAQFEKSIDNKLLEFETKYIERLARVEERTKKN